MKKTSNKGFSMVELIIVIAIMAILAAALAPALIKYINKSRLSTDISTGTSIASAMNSALAVESAYDDAFSFTTATQLNSLLGQSAGNSYAKELADIIGASVKGKTKKDLNNGAISQEYWVLVNPGSNKVQVWYGAVDTNHLISPEVGASLEQK